MDISQVIVDDVSNYGRSIWIAGGSGTPDFTSDFLGSLTTLGVQTSSDDATDGIFVYNLTGLTDMDYILVGTPPRDSYGPLSGMNSSIQFYINGLNVAPTAVPIPAAVWLFSSGLLALFGISRHKRVA